MAAVAVLLVAQFQAEGQGRASTRDGVYSEAQATRGQAAYKTACASCHGATLQGSGPATPPLAGSDFTGNWTGQTLADLLDRMQTTMPADHPGSLSRAQNTDILAYMLKANQFPAGKTDLPSDAAALKQIQFEAPKQ